MIDGATGLHDPERMRRADADLLSLALIDARNRTLRWLALFEAVPPERRPDPADAAALSPALWLAGHAGWFQERWIARQLQRGRGSAADPTHAPLASIEPDADDWWDAAACAPADRWALALPGFDATRRYLVDTFDTTSELLANAGAGDDALHWYRAALFHEDALAERFAALAQAFELTGALELLPAATVRALRSPIWFPAQRWSPGSPPGGWVPDDERAGPAEPVPEFEIDAQPVAWAQYAEFVEDGGYDDARWWSAAGWAWLQALGRRSPRYVEQLRHGVLLNRCGRMQRAAATQPAQHLSWHEADAWCRWAGRRLVTEIEWELAAAQGASRGFVWGEVREWVSGSARRWSGEPLEGAPGAGLRVQRAAVLLEPRRLAHVRRRLFVAPGRDEGFAGFRSCAVA